MHFIADELSLWLLGLFCSSLVIRKSVALHARESICVTPLWSHREQSNAARYIGEYIYVSVEWRAESGERWLESGKLTTR